ncbi:hypothetical protein [Streptomyces olivochromogenes]|uniref:hypothetical protein n=1 Tax=Streptomyces olivochromogenes TaxID=1963 RepID=UPI001F2B32C5|nr:hypothetical protein [Streptomyces olivochromogenes]
MTTVTVARDLAARMDYDTGQVRYCLAGMVARLGLSRATIGRHVSYLREMGSLVWAVHGTRVNVRRARGLGGYAGTATVYAAVIPPVYDHAMGHGIVGSGYSARVVIDQRGQAPAAVQPAKPVDNPPVDHRSSAPSETPSLTRVRCVGKAQVVGGKDSSTAARAAAQISSRRKKRRLTILGYKITSERIEQARRLAVSVRPQVHWIQTSRYDQLSWVLLDMVAMGWSEPKIVLWLHQVGHTAGTRRWRPRSPHRLIAAALRRHDHAATQKTIVQGPDYEQAARHSTAPNNAFQQAREKVQPDMRQGVEYPALDDIPEDIWDRAILHHAVDAALVRSFALHVGRDETIRVYGSKAAEILDAADENARAGLASRASSPEAICPIPAS